jgi:thiol-disulfide isomerase/thioredoxin
MKKILLFISALIFYGEAFAQYDTTPPYLKSKIIPNFSLVNLDSVAFNQTVLVSGKKTIIMLFNPECEHCQDQLKLLLSIPEVADSANLILTATETLQKIKIFHDKFHVANYPWIHIGKDYKYFFGGFYQPKTIPVLAFYNTNKQLVYFNQGSVKKAAILEALKK